MAKRPSERPRWVTLREALTTFAKAEDGVTGQRHIRPLHWYVACRLVVEGGFAPDDIVLRPPFRIVGPPTKEGFAELVHDPDSAVPGERTVLGGLKTKDIDVVVSRNGIGPCVAVSLKGTLNAFRNLTNRMEETAGNCTNLHISYPALVYSFWNVMRANHEGLLPPGCPKGMKPDRDGNVKVADVAIRSDGKPSDQITRYHFALEGLAGRSSVRDEPSMYEAVALTLVNVEPDRFGEVFEAYPEPNSALLLDRMFETLYRQYDLRFIYQAPALESRTRRLAWLSDSPALTDSSPLEYGPRLAPA